MERSRNALMLVTALVAFGAALASSTGPSEPTVRPPVPLSPPPGSKGVLPNVELVVEPCPAEQFHFRVTRAGTSQLVAEGYTSRPSWVVEPLLNSLLPGKYAWTCRAQYRGEWSKFFTPEWYFEVAEPSGSSDDIPKAIPDAPVPVSPIPGTKARGGPVTLVVDGPLTCEYHWRVFQSASGGTIAEGFTTGPTWNVPVMMPYVPGIYFWTCRVSDGQGWSPFFEPAWWYELEKPGSGTAGRAIAGRAATKACPNPCGQAGTTFLYNVARPGGSSVSICSPDGRLVRNLRMAHVSAGPCQVAWDGRDETGRPVGAGTYLCRIVADGAQDVVSLTKSR